MSSTLGHEWKWFSEDYRNATDRRLKCAKCDSEENTPEAMKPCAAMTDQGNARVDTSRAAIETELARWPDVITFNKVRDMMLGLLAERDKLRRAARLLPLDAFDKEPDTIDAAEFVDNASSFMEAMDAFRAALGDEK